MYTGYHKQVDLSSKTGNTCWLTTPVGDGPAPITYKLPLAVPHKINRYGLPWQLAFLCIDPAMTHIIHFIYNIIWVDLKREVPVSTILPY